MLVKHSLKLSAQSRHETQPSMPNKFIQKTLNPLTYLGRWSLGEIFYFLTLSFSSSVLSVLGLSACALQYVRMGIHWLERTVTNCDPAQ